jgi:hypothetical protein
MLRPNRELSDRSAKDCGDLWLVIASEIRELGKTWLHGSPDLRSFRDKTLRAAELMTLF